MQDRTQRDVLLRCLAPSADRSVRDALAALDATQWTVLVEHAQLHRTGPLLFARLATAGAADHVPEPLFLQLQNETAQNRTRNEQRLRRLADAVTALGHTGIPTLILKGMHLAQSIYQSLDVRYMRDIDLLVPQARLADTERVLLDLGYGPRDRPSIAEDCSWNLHLSPFTRLEDDGSYTVLEAHWRIEQPTSPFDIDHDALWNHSEQMHVLGATARVLGNEDLLLHLCLHAGFHHGFDVDLRHMCDIAWVLDRRMAAIDWSRFTRAAQAASAHRVVYVCLAAVAALFGGAVPEAMMDALAPAPADRAIVALVVEHVWRGAKKPTSTWLATRRPINDWLRAVTGIERRDHEPPPSYSEIPMDAHAVERAREAAMNPRGASMTDLSTPLVDV